jgi:putative polymerase
MPIQSTMQSSYSPSFVGSRSQTSRASGRAAMAIVVAAAFFNFVLCILSTRGFPIGAGPVVSCEIALLAGATFLAWNTLTRQFLGWSFVLFCYLAFLALCNKGLDLKIARDLAIPLVFCALGLAVRDRRFGDYLVYTLVILVLVVGLFELFDLADYQRLVDISAYYVDKGSLDFAQAQLVGGELFVSGIRPNAESHLLDILGGHRVSSIFLEPVSAGNFPVIAMAWLVCRFKLRPRLNTFFILLCIVEVVLADARFGALTCLVIALLLAMPAARQPSAVFSMPYVAVAVLMIMASTLRLHVVNDDITGRLFGSGSLLQSLDLMQWLGLRASDRSTVDCGYGYLFTNAGVIAASALWFAFMGNGKADKEAALIRCAFAVYIALSLSINASVFTIKTAALLWFLYGLVYPGDRTTEPRATRIERWRVFQHAKHR